MGTCNSTGVIESDMLTNLPTFKVAIVGDVKTGKTSVLNRFARNCYFKDYYPTKKVEIVNVIRKVNVPDHAIVSLSLWDTPGRDDIDLTDTYFTGLDAAVVVVDVTSDDSMEMAGYWRQQVVNTLTRRTEMSAADALGLPILLLGNKYDLIDKEKPHHASDPEIGKEETTEKQEDCDELTITKIDSKWQPACVDKIKHLTEQHGFISGVMVSAKDPDGSVSLAMQTLVRHLVDKNLELIYGPNYWKKQKKKKKPKVQPSGVDTSLTLTGIESIDACIKICEEPIQRITELKTSYEQSLANLKLACADAEIIPAEHYTKATLEQCITALKLEIGNELVVEDIDKDMIRLSVAAGDQPRGENARVLDRFNKGLFHYNEFAVVCAVILHECQSLQTSLRKLDKKILKNHTEVWENQQKTNNNDKEETTQLDFKVISVTIERNRVQIAESLLWIEELEKHAERARDKVKTALMW